MTWAARVGLLVLLSSLGCKTTSRTCDESLCPTGCCDAAGSCRHGDEASACGQNGVACSVCTQGTACSLGFCVGMLSTGGGNGATGGGASTGGGAGGGTGGSGGGYGPNDFHAFCVDFVTELRRVYVECLGVPAYYDPASCDLPTTRLPPRTEFDAARAGLCVEKVRAAHCASFVSQSCDYFRGAVALGGACERSGECARGLYCEQNLTCPFTCMVQLGAGAPTTDRFACRPPLYEYNGTCILPASVGQSCAPLNSTSDQSCEEGAYCSMTKVCMRLPATRLAEGDACDSVTQYQCTLGMKCAQGKCAKPLPAGAPCGADAQCWNGCVKEVGATVGICGPLAEGHACTAATAHDCAEGLYCTSTVSAPVGACAKLKPNGSPCSGAAYATECASGLCSATAEGAPGSCAAPGGAGATCWVKATLPCAGGLYCTATTASPIGVCAAAAGLNAPCTLGVTWCGSSLSCHAPVGSMTGRCLVQSPVNATCNPRGDECESNLYCKAAGGNSPGTCTPVKSQGEACTGSIECYGSCVNGTCRGCPGL